MPDLATGETANARTASTLTAEAAVQMFPSFESLLLLKDAGWKFFPNDGTQAESLLDGARVWPHGWRDAIRVRDEDDALGLRIHYPGDRHSPSEITWEYSGSLTETVYKLLALPEPETRLAPGRAIGSAPKLWTP